MDMGKLEEWLSTIPSKSTRKNYLAGIRKFESYYPKPIEDLIGSSEAGTTIERYYAWLKDKGHPQNTRRNLCNVAIQFLKFFKTSVDYNKHLGIYKTVMTVKDHLVTISEVQELAKVADLREQILLEVYLLGLRIGDVSTLEWKTFDIQGACPLSIMIHCGKEETTASSFISEEFQQLLQKYVPQLDKSNPYLFQSKRSGHLTSKQIDKILKSLVKRAGIKNGTQLFRWHCGRKLVLRSCAELGLNQWSAKMLVGKSVSPDIATYISGVQLKNDFIKLSNVLKLFPKQASGDNKKMLDVMMKALRTLIEEELMKQGVAFKRKEFKLDDKRLEALKKKNKELVEILTKLEELRQEEVRA